MLTIFLGGKARVGKTTVANAIAKYAYEHNYSPIKLSFASILKQEVEQEYNITKESDPEKYRKLCQALGSSKRIEDPDYWISKLNKQLLDLKRQDLDNLEQDRSAWHEKIVIIDDCRYMNEVGFGRKIGALLIFVAHDTRLLIDHTADWRQHESESLANKTEKEEKDFTDIFHYRINNNKTMKTLENKLQKIIPEWLICAGDLFHTALVCTCTSCIARRNDTLTFGGISHDTTGK